ncbi:MAG: glycosyltransferase family 4 protein [Anaerolineae bacterium]|jgi:glycosyltransferase involved in cell wall biosynthesis|nr:glycosyltransferase family 4 protein [Anaerolineae bacterium]
MRIGIVIPNFSADEDDFALPVYQNLIKSLAIEAEVRVIALRYPPKRDPYLLHGAQVYPLGAGDRRGIGRLALWYDAIRLIQRLHREAPFEVLHSMWADEAGLIAGYAGRLIGTPVVVSVAGGELVGLRDIAYGSQLTRLGRWIVRQAISSADRVIVASQYSRECLRALYPQARATVIPLGIDLNLFTPSLEVYQANHLIQVGSLMGVKGHATLFRALQQLPDCTLDLIGTGYEREQLIELTAHLGIADRVRFLGMIPHRTLPSHYRKAALNVLPSRHEGQGMVTLEAAACGVPTVGTRVGLLPDLPEVGIAVPVDDVDQLAEAIRLMLSERARWSESALRTAQDYTIADTIRQWLGIYRTL